MEIGETVEGGGVERRAFTRHQFLAGGSYVIYSWETRKQ